MKQLLIVWHSQFGGTAQMAQAARDGALEAGEVEVRYLELRRTAGVERSSCRCDALLVATSENFGSLAGMTKDFFERVFYPCEHRARGQGVHASSSARAPTARGAMFQTDRIATGLSLAQGAARNRLEERRSPRSRRSFRRRYSRAMPASLGATLAAGLSVGHVLTACSSGPKSGSVWFRRLYINNANRYHSLMHAGAPPPPQATLHPQESSAASPRKVASTELFAGDREIVIEHGGRHYRLRIAQNDKLILTA